MGVGDQIKQPKMEGPCSPKESTRDCLDDENYEETTALDAEREKDDYYSVSGRSTPELYEDSSKDGSNLDVGTHSPFPDQDDESYGSFDSFSRPHSAPPCENVQDMLHSVVEVEWAGAPDMDEFVCSVCRGAGEDNGDLPPVEIVQNLPNTLSTDILPVICTRPECRNFCQEIDSAPGSDMDLARNGKARSESTGSGSDFSLRSTTRTERVILIILCMTELCSAMSLSIMAPFFPKEANIKGVTDSVSGWIFGAFALVQFIFSPVFGKLMPVLGCRFLFLAGQFFGGGCVILFGVLDFVDAYPSNNLVFISLCFLLRVAMAIGCTASNVSTFTAMVHTFRDNSAIVFGFLETAAGLGLMLGPALGGFLYDLGGFFVPFAVLGGLMLLNLVISACFLPSMTESKRSRKSSSLTALLASGPVLVVCLAVTMAAFLWAILDPLLEPHLSTFHMSASMLGLIFLLMSAFYAIFSPVWGRVADMVDDSTPLLILGLLVSAVGHMLLGPSPLFKLTDTLWLNIVSLVILGISVSLATVPTFDKLLCVAQEGDEELHFAQYSMIAGVWGACYALGEFLGPSLGGVLMDNIGFGWTMTCTAAASVVMALLLTVLWIYESKCKKYEPVFDESESDDERVPILRRCRSLDLTRHIRKRRTHMFHGRMIRAVSRTLTRSGNISQSQLWL